MVEQVEYSLVPETEIVAVVPPPITNEDILKYICDQSDMYFYSSTFGQDLETIRANQMVLNMYCNSFFYKNSTKDDAIALHYFFSDDLKPRE